MNEEDLFQEIRLHLPKYLSPANQRDLWQDLKAFPDTRSYYATEPTLTNQLLQGDGWKGFVAINFHTLEKKSVSGIVLSNSCDISPENPRPLVPNILFAPLVRLDRYCDLLRDAGSSQATISSLLDSIRKQKVTSIFYLPARTDALPESIALLHDVHGHPLDDFLANERSSLFTLNQFAFYLFLFKISIHLTRMQEEVIR
jgi:hypothetical protein